MFEKDGKKRGRKELTNRQERIVVDAGKMAPRRA